MSRSTTSKDSAVSCRGVVTAADLKTGALPLDEVGEAEMGAQHLPSAHRCFRW